MGNSLTPGNAHFPVIDFRRQHSQYTHYWVIEYDVRYTGRWADFFAAFEATNADLLTAGIVRYDDAQEWSWWDSLSHPKHHVPMTDRIHSFNPIYRISGAALDFIDEAHRKGWTGHNEVILPTLLYQNGYVIEDFGGEGEFVPEGRTNMWYTSEGLDDFGVPDSGTHRFRPRFWRAGGQSDMIYHPVKPISWFIKRKIRRLTRLKWFANPFYVYRRSIDKIF